MNDKRELLIETALTLFYRHGIRAVGINEVLKQSGIAKKTLYHHFAGKEELIAAALEHRDTLFYGWLSAEMAQYSPGLPAIKGLFATLDRWLHGDVEQLSPFRGCFFINTAVEYGQEAEGLRETCQQHKQKVRTLIQSCLTEKQQAQPGLLDTLCLLKEGAIVTAQVNNDSNAARACLPLLESLLGEA